MEVEVVVAGPAGEDPGGVEEGGDGGEGLEEGEELEQEAEAAADASAVLRTTSHGGSIGGDAKGI